MSRPVPLQDDGLWFRVLTSLSAQPTILVVDDDRDFADLYAMWVDEDYEVVTASDGRTALERMHGGVDVVLLGRHMPDIDGDRVLEQIRSMDTTAE